MQFPVEFADFFKGQGGALRVFKSGPGAQALLAHNLRVAGQEVVLVASGAREFRELAGLLHLFAGETDEQTPAFEQPFIALPQHLPKKPLAEDWGPRWAALHALCFGRKPRVILLTVDNLLPRWPGVETVEQSCLTLTKGEDMYLQEKESVYDLKWNDRVTYGNVYHQNEVEQSKYNFELSDAAMLLDMFNKFEGECKRLCEAELPWPAYDYCLKCSHTFNLLDARGAISITERTAYIGRVRALASAIAALYAAQRERMGYPMCLSLQRCLGEGARRGPRARPNLWPGKYRTCLPSSTLPHRAP